MTQSLVGRVTLRDNGKAVGVIDAGEFSLEESVPHRRDEQGNRERSDLFIAHSEDFGETRIAGYVLNGVPEIVDANCFNEDDLDVDCSELSFE